MKKLPMSAVTEPVGARSTPASPASAMPNPNTGVTQRLTLMPSARDRSASSVEARTIMPTRVLVSTSQTARQTTIEKTAANSWYVDSDTAPSGDPAVEPGRQLVGQPGDAVLALDQVDEQQREPEGEQEVVERVEPQQPLDEQPLHQHAEQEHRDRS